MLSTPTSQDKQYKQWLALCDAISRTTVEEDGVRNETAMQKQSRVAGLLSDFQAFCAYYFPHYCRAPFGWFHLRAAYEIANRPNCFAVLEFPREHAKSVFGDVLMPLYLKAKGELTGLVLASANEDKASGLLGDVQAELVSNRRYLSDFGEQMQQGKWQDGYFATKDGVGFWAIGRGQSPRGIREGANRPNYIAVDDIDDAQLVKNLVRVREVVDWVLGDLYGAASIKGSRLVVLGNRIHRQSVLAHLVGDTEQDKPKRDGLIHIKVFATEDPTTRNELALEMGGVPAWKENYTVEMLRQKFQTMGTRLVRREYYHEDIKEGTIFKEAHLQQLTPLAKKYDCVISYCDPSFKDTAKSDYKAIILLGRRGNSFDILKVWARQASISSMVQAHYDMHEWCKVRDISPRHYLEGGFIQPDLYLNEYKAAVDRRGYVLPLSIDTRKKDQKEARIESLQPLFERGVIYWNEAEYHGIDMKTLRDQLLGFPQGHDDAPDALEGAMYILNQQLKRSAWQPMLGLRQGGGFWGKS